ncbi:hypothetical protein TNCV_3536871 [Trichonephila clavipes]|uniref:Uncharacterized protein n=1 Tax=Trichonephila clavipes TaxID=2585209 RepID=A0A8X6VWR3_TRICX|nr:hypothetical protein TNCV_3536871 [Trichonephila clavipes]
MKRQPEVPNSYDFRKRSLRLLKRYRTMMLISPLKAVPSLPPTAADPKAGVRRRHMTEALEEKNKNPDREEATRYDIP